MFSEKILENSELNPISFYGQCKKEAELILNKFTLHNDLFYCTCIRIFSVFSQDMHKQVVFDIFNSFITKKDIVFKGSGNNIRSFIHVESIIKVIIKFINLECLKNKFDIFNYGSLINNLEIKDLVKSINSFYGFKYKYVFDEKNVFNDPLYLIPNLDKIRNLFGEIEDDNEISSYFYYYHNLLAI
jgi:nucleoside-diphosphate-sugar epimerase